MNARILPSLSRLYHFAFREVLWGFLDHCHRVLSSSWIQKTETETETETETDADADVVVVEYDGFYQYYAL